MQFVSGLTAPTAMPSTVMAYQAPSGQAIGELCAGAVVRVGQHTFCVTKPLGKGSFSSVWTAVNMDGSGPELALKETLCCNQTELQDAESEGRIVQQVGGTSSRIPELIAIETVPNGAGANIVRMAMSKIPGESLGAYLNSWKQRHGGVLNSSNPQVIATQAAEACVWTLELISQLLPAFESISQRAIHRDVNTHNVLVSIGGEHHTPQFGLIDFGLAIETQNWGSLSTQVPVVGDCRYWPVSAWFIFAAGGQELAKQPQLLHEYRTQLDLHALGITALQLFVEMMPQPVAGTAAANILPEEFRILKRAWDQYWQDAYRFWEPLFHAFERKTDWAKLRQSYLASNVHLKIGEDLANLRQALGLCRDACSRADSGSQLFAARAVFACLFELINQGGKALPGEAAPNGVRLASWHNIRSILAAAGVSSASSHPPPLVPVPAGSHTVPMGVGRGSGSTTMPMSQTARGTTTSMSAGTSTMSSRFPQSFVGTASQFASAQNSMPMISSPSAAFMSYAPVASPPYTSGFGMGQRVYAA